MINEDKYRAIAKLADLITEKCLTEISNGEDLGIRRGEMYPLIFMEVFKRELNKLNQ